MWLFISSIENLCRESNEPLAKIDYTGLNLEESLKKLSFHILKLITAKRSVELHRLAIGEAMNCPDVGEAWYTHGPARTASFIQSVLKSHRDELRKTTVPIERIAVMLHDSLTGDILYRLLAGVGKHENDAGTRAVGRHCGGHHSWERSDLMCLKSAYLAHMESLLSVRQQRFS